LKAYTFDGVSLLFRNVNLGCARRKCSIVLFAQQLKESFLVLANELGNLGVTLANLLKDRLQHLRLLLD
jgi:hypothetical protein